MNTTKNKIVLFDFDGVIADSFKVCFDIQKMICPHLKEDGYRERFEGNINDWEEPINAHTEECRQDVDFFAELIPRMKNEVQIVPGMKEVICELEKKYMLIVVSSTITSPIREFLESHDLANHFTQIMGNDVHASKVEKIKMVFDKYGVGADKCVFITDTLGDMIEAEKTGVSAIGITWGYQYEGTLLKGNPFRIIKSPADLVPAVSDYFSQG